MAALIAEFPTFTPVTASTMRDIAGLARDYEHVADFNPVALWCWNRGYPGGVSQLYGNPVIRWKDPSVGVPFLTFAARAAVPQTVSTLLDYADHHGLSQTLRAIPATREEMESEIGDEFTVAADRDNYDYLLCVDDWARLHGAEFRNMRNTINKLERRLDLSLRPLSLEDPSARTAIDGLCHTWAEQRGVSEADFLPELTAIRNLFARRVSEHLYVPGAFVNDTLVGFSINEVLADGVAIGHFAKANYSHPGVYTYLLHHTCGYLRSEGVKVLNIEADLGIPGLRQAKMLLKPARLLEKVMVCRA